MDSFVENLFDQKIFLILFGLIFYYVILWSMARNSKSKQLKARLELSESKTETALVYQDPKYKFDFKDWFHHQKDELVVAFFASLLLIEFDDVAIELINNQLEKDITAGNWIYLTGGVIGDLLYRVVAKIRS